MIITTDNIFKKISSKLQNLNKDLSLETTSPELVSGIVVRLGVNLDAKILSKFSNLKFIATITTGLDHIDLTYCHQHGIQVISLKGETTFLNTITATPEHTWGLLLSLTRKIPASNLAVKKGSWDRDQFFGNELAGKNLGLIGFGRVGRIVSEYANAFRMSVYFYDPFVEQDGISNAQKMSLDDVLETSDIISLHPPLNDSTEHLITKDHFSKMRKYPFFINTSRGKIVKEDDLLWALENQKIKGAALDVLEFETEFENKKIKSSLFDYFNKNDNLIITPHIAGSSFESMEKTALFIEDKILKMRI